MQLTYENKCYAANNVKNIEHVLFVSGASNLFSYVIYRLFYILLKWNKNIEGRNLIAWPVYSDKLHSSPR